VSLPTTGIYNRFDEIIDDLAAEIVASAQAIVRLKSVKSAGRPGMPFGEDIDECFRYALALSSELGFRTKDVDGFAGHAEMGSGDRIVGVLGHLDVVPEGDGWMYPPYAAEIHDGKLYGRGTSDDKGAIIASMYAIVALQKAGVAFDKRVRVIFGLDEESGMASVRAYLEREEEPDVAFTPDGAFPAIHGEKGIYTFRLHRQNSDSGGEHSGLKVLSIKGGVRTNVVPDYCEAVVQGGGTVVDDLIRAAGSAGEGVVVERSDNDRMVVRALGVPAHGAAPAAGINAISKLLLFLQSQPIVSQPLSEVVDFYCQAIGNESDGRSLGCGIDDDLSGPLTLNVGIIDVNSDDIDILCNIRYPVTATLSDVSDPIRRAAQTAALELIDLSHQGPLYIPKDSDLVSNLMKSYRDVTHDYESSPMVIGGGTYAKSVRNTIAFGPGFPGKSGHGHQVDEFMSIEDLILCTRIYARAIYELLQ